MKIPKAFQVFILCFAYFFEIYICIVTKDELPNDIEKLKELVIKCDNVIQNLSNSIQQLGDSIQPLHEENDYLNKVVHCGQVPLPYDVEKAEEIVIKCDNVIQNLSNSIQQLRDFIQPLPDENSNDNSNKIVLRGKTSLPNDAEKLKGIVIKCDIVIESLRNTTQQLRESVQPLQDVNDRLNEIVLGEVPEQHRKSVLKKMKMIDGV